MAKKEANPTGVYKPLTWRAKRLTAQLRRATHRTVQNAIIAELIHELTRGSRRVRRQAGQWRTQVRNLAGRHAARAGSAVRRNAGSMVRRVRFGAPMHCITCNKEFRSKLLFNAHAEAHKREQTLAPRNSRHLAAGRQGPVINSGMTLARRQHASPAQGTPIRIPVRMRPARAHAAATLAAAGPEMAKTARTAAAKAAGPDGRPLGAKDLKAMAQQVTATRNAPPARTARKPAARPAEPRTPAAAARAAVNPQMAARAPRTPAARPARSAPSRPGPGA
jgi:hypothetical protein